MRCDKICLRLVYTKLVQIITQCLYISVHPCGGRIGEATHVLLEVVFVLKVLDVGTIYLSLVLLALPDTLLAVEAAYPSSFSFPLIMTTMSFSTMSN